MIFKGNMALLTLILCVVIIVSPPSRSDAKKRPGRVQDQNLAETPKKQERELDDRIPQHLPIRIKVKKEKEEAFKDIKNEHWARDLEIEVTNIGDKDIYFLSLGLFAPEIKAPDGSDISFPLHYGRDELANLPAKAQSDDTPVKPHETIVLKLLRNNVLAYEAFNRNLKRSQPTKIVVHFRTLNFGDGTGFTGWDGVFFDSSHPVA